MTNASRSGRVIVYEQFTNEWGNLDATEAGRRGPGWFTAKNMQRYTNGLFGPRGGLKDIGVTGVSNGELLALNNYISGSSPAFWWVQGTAVRRAIGRGNAQTTLTGTLGATANDKTELAYPRNPSTVKSNISYLSITDDATYKVDLSADSFSSIDTTAHGRSMAFLGDRLFIASNTTSPRRVFFSDANDFDTFNALSFFDVDYRDTIRQLLSHRDSLLIRVGNWWRMHGTPGTDEVVRQMAAGEGVSKRQHAAVLDSDLLGWYISDGRNLLATFNGSQVDEKSHSHLRLGPTDSESVIGASNLNIGSLLFGSDNSDALLRYEGVWTKHSFEVSVKDFIIPFGAVSFVLATPGDANNPPVFYELEAQRTRPGFTSDTRAQPGDDSTTPFDAHLHFPEQWDESGKEVLVRQVIVDFRKWDTGSGSTNHFEVDVDALSRFAAVDVQSSTTQSFDEAGSSTTTSGEDERAVFNIGGQGWGGGFQVKLNAIRGVAIKRVAVVVDSREQRIQ